MLLTTTFSAPTRSPVQGECHTLITKSSALSPRIASHDHPALCKFTRLVPHPDGKNFEYIKPRILQLDDFSALHASFLASPLYHEWQQLNKRNVAHTNGRGEPPTVVETLPTIGATTFYRGVPPHILMREQQRDCADALGRDFDFALEFIKEQKKKWPGMWSEIPTILDGFIDWNLCPQREVLQLAFDGDNNVDTYHAMMQKNIQAAKKKAAKQVKQCVTANRAGPESGRATLARQTNALPVNLTTGTFKIIQPTCAWNECVAESPCGIDKLKDALQFEPPAGAEAGTYMHMTAAQNIIPADQPNFTSPILLRPPTTLSLHSLPVDMTFMQTHRRS